MHFFLNPQMIPSIDRASRVSLKVYTTLESHTRGGEGIGEVLLGLIFAGNMSLASQEPYLIVVYSVAK